LISTPSYQLTWYDGLSLKAGFLAAHHPRAFSLGRDGLLSMENIAFCLDLPVWERGKIRVGSRLSRTKTHQAKIRSRFFEKVPPRFQGWGPGPAVGVELPDDRRAVSVSAKPTGTAHPPRRSFR
jgi:hypothetical protein